MNRRGETIDLETCDITARNIANTVWNGPAIRVKAGTAETDPRQSLEEIQNIAIYSAHDEGQRTQFLDHPCGSCRS